MADHRKVYPVNYQGYEVVQSHSAECPVEYKKRGSKFCPVYDDLRSLSAAMQKLNQVREELKNSKYMKNSFEYSSYILKVNAHTFELHFKAYVLP